MKVVFPVVGSGICFLLFAVLDCLQYEDKFNNLEWNSCHGVVCTDGAPAIEGKNAGLRTFIKTKAPNVESTHCFIHREAVVSKELGVDLHEVLNSIVKAVNYIKTRPMKSRFFSSKNCVTN